MNILKDAVEAGVPLISVQTDDYIYIEDALAEATGKKIVEYSPGIKHPMSNTVYWTAGESQLKPDNARDFFLKGMVLVAVNASPSPFVFDAGFMPPTPNLMRRRMVAHLPKSKCEEVESVLKGLSVGTAERILLMTIARTGGYATPDLRKTRVMLGKSVQGLESVETDISFYKFPPKLKDWLDLNKDYFFSKDIPPQLRPRGVMLEGAPGVGKSMSAKAIAKTLKLPLYRLNISASLSKYVGESESHIAKSLSLLESNSPCVLLIDEVEKIFSGNDNDAGVTQRILSQLLWWLSDHQSPVFTIMTTNDLTNIPPEFYRAGRVDLTMKIPKMSLSESHAFSLEVFSHVLGKKPSTSQIAALKNVLSSTGHDDFAHSEVSELVYREIKFNKWI